MVRLVVGLTLGPRQRAVMLDALGAEGGSELGVGAAFAALLERAFMSGGGVELVELVVRGQLRARLVELAPLSWATMAEEWQARGDEPRTAAALLLTVATRAGWVWRRLEERVVQDLEARAIDAARLRPPALRGPFLSAVQR